MHRTVQVYLGPKGMCIGEATVVSVQCNGALLGGCECIMLQYMTQAGECEMLILAVQLIRFP